MRTAALTILFFVAFVFAANAQKFTLLPQVGFENSRTLISYNNLASFAPLGGEFMPQVGVRLDYKFKQGFGPYLSLNTSRTSVNYTFTDPEMGMNLFDASAGDMQIRLEGGYQFATNPIKLGSSKSPNLESSVGNALSKSYYSEKSYSRTRCSKSYSSSSGRCCSSSKAAKSSNKNSGAWVRLQPSIGIGYIPFLKPDVTVKTQGGQTTYEYRAGNWNTALVTGLGFEFGKNSQRLFNVSINYFNGFGNLAEQTITSTAGGKTTVAHLNSDASGWNLRLGIPFTFSKARPSSMKNSEHKSPCSQYRMINRYRCNRS